MRIFSAFIRNDIVMIADGNVTCVIAFMAVNIWPHTYTDRRQQKHQSSPAGLEI